MKKHSTNLIKPKRDHLSNRVNSFEYDIVDYCYRVGEKIRVFVGEKFTKRVQNFTDHSQNVLFFIFYLDFCTLG